LAGEVNNFDPFHGSSNKNEENGRYIQVALAGRIRRHDGQLEAGAIDSMKLALYVPRPAGSTSSNRETSS